MFSLHIDTARTWRGGQNQVLLTVLGPARARPPGGARGASRRRAAPARRGGRRGPAARGPRRDGLPRRLAAVARRSGTLRRTSCTRTIRTGWPGRCRRALHRHAGAPTASWSPRAASTSTSAATRSRAGSTGRSTASSAASEAIRAMLVAGRHPARPDRTPCTRASTSSASPASPPANVHAEFWLPHAGAGRRQHRRARAAQGPALPRSTPRRSSCGSSRRAVRHRGRRRAPAGARAPDPRPSTSRSTSS